MDEDNIMNDAFDPHQGHLMQHLDDLDLDFLDEDLNGNQCHSAQNLDDLDLDFLDEDLKANQGHSMQYLDGGNLNAPNEGFDAVFRAYLDHDQSNAVQHPDLMPPEGDFNLNQGNLAQYHDGPDLDDDESGRDIPRHLPENALETSLVGLLDADGHQQRYLTVRNAPIDNYIAQKINDGNEFAVGGDPSHILTSLNQEFRSRPEGRWHVVVVPEGSLWLAGTPRWSFSPDSETTESEIQSPDQSWRPQQNTSDSESLASAGSVNVTDPNHAPRDLNYQADHGFNTLAQVQQNNDFDRSLTTGESVNQLQQGDVIHGFNEAGQPQLNDAFDHSMTSGELTDLLDPRLFGQGSYNQPQSGVNQIALNLSQPIPAQHAHLPQPPAVSEYNSQNQLRQGSIEDSNYQQQTEQEDQGAEDAATIETDTMFGDYSGTNLCRWCGRRGHEAVQCIKWEPDYFDKPVCVICNNKKHLIDDCPLFLFMSEADKAQLLLVVGAKKPGVRSMFSAWTGYVQYLDEGFDPSVTALPMTRAYLKDLSGTEIETGGRMWEDLWKTFPYGDWELPDQFHDKELVLEGQDEDYGLWYPADVSP